MRPGEEVVPRDILVADFDSRAFYREDVQIDAPEKKLDDVVDHECLRRDRKRLDDNRNAQVHAASL